MDETMTKSKLLELLHSNRAALDDVINLVPKYRMTEPLSPGEWFIKDIIAHITLSRISHITSAGLGYNYFGFKMLM